MISVERLRVVWMVDTKISPLQGIYSEACSAMWNNHCSCNLPGVNFPWKHQSSSTCGSLRGYLISQGHLYSSQNRFVSYMSTFLWIKWAFLLLKMQDIFQGQIMWFLNMISANLLSTCRFLQSILPVFLVLSKFKNSFWKKKAFLLKCKLTIKSREVQFCLFV